MGPVGSSLNKSRNTQSALSIVPRTNPHTLFRLNQYVGILALSKELIAHEYRGTTKLIKCMLIPTLGTSVRRIGEKGRWVF